MDHKLFQLDRHTPPDVLQCAFKALLNRLWVFGEPWFDHDDKMCYEWAVEEEVFNIHYLTLAAPINKVRLDTKLFLQAYYAEEMDSGNPQEISIGTHRELILTQVHQLYTLVILIQQMQRPVPLSLGDPYQQFLYTCLPLWSTDLAKDFVAVNETFKYDFAEDEEEADEEEMKLPEERDEGELPVDSDEFETVDRMD